MTENHMQAIAKGPAFPESLDPGKAASVSPASSSTSATSILSRAQASSISPDSSNLRRDTQSTLESFDATQDVNNANSNSTILQPNARPVGDWFKTVMFHFGNTLEAEPRASVNDKVYEEIAREATARSLLELRNGGKVRPALNSHEIDNEAEEPLVVQSPSGSINERQSGSSSASGHEPTPNGYLRALVPPLRSEAEACSPVHEATPEPSEEPMFCQTYNTGRGWTPVNAVPKVAQRPEDDLTIVMNSIIPAPGASIDIRFGRTMSTPILRSPSTPKRKRCPTRAASDPVDGKANGTGIADPKTNSDDCTASSGRSKAAISIAAPADAIEPLSTAVASPVRRAKWKGKSFQLLILEALRAATDTEYSLTTKQIAAHIERYRITTDMTEPALAQTIRAAVMNGAQHRKRDGSLSAGLWKHCPEEGKRTGPYKLLPEGFEGDVRGAENAEGVEDVEIAENAPDLVETEDTVVDDAEGGIGGCEG